jgi:ComEC/Rec2-related protein
LDSGEFEKREKALLRDDEAFVGFAERVAQKEAQKRKRPNPSGHGIALYQHYVTPALIAIVLGMGWALWMAESLLFSLPWTVFVGLVSLLLGTLCLSRRHGILRWGVWLLMLLVGVGYGSFRLTLQQEQPWQQVGHVHQAELKGVVTSAHVRGKKTIWDIDIATLQDSQGKTLIDARETFLPPKIQVNIPKSFIEDSEVSPVGASVQLRGSVRPPFSTDIPGAFNESAYLKGQGIGWVMNHVSVVSAVPSSASSASIDALSRVLSGLKTFRYQSFALFGQLRQRVANGFQKALPSPFQEVLGGLVLGSHAVPLDKEVKQAFIDTGMIHILAASGMNVGIIAGVSLFGFKGLLSLWALTKRRFYKNRDKQGLRYFSSENAEATAIVLTMLCVLFYAGMTGLPPSILRAGGMIELALLLKLMNREARPLTILAVCVLVICLLDPFLLANIGFQLSVLSTLGLVLMIPPLSRWLSPWVGPHLAGVLLVPIVAQMWVFPLTVYYFNQFPLHSIPLNILAVYLITPLTILGFVSGGFMLVFEPVGVLLAEWAYPLLWTLLSRIQSAYHWEWAQWSLASFSPLSIGIGYTTLAVMAWLCLTRQTVETTFPIKRKIAIGLLMLSLWAGVTTWDRYQQFSHFKIAHLPLGRNRSVTVIQWPPPSPFQTPRISLIAPAQMTYWQENHVLEYLKHKGLSSYLGEILIQTPSEAASSSKDYFWVKRITQTTQSPVPVLLWGNPQILSQEIVYGVAEGYWMKGLGEKQLWHSQKVGPAAKGIWRDAGGLNFRQGHDCLRIQENAIHENGKASPLSKPASCALSLKLDSTGSPSMMAIETKARSPQRKFFALNHYLEARQDGLSLFVVE